MDLSAYHRHGVRASRVLKPSIPMRDSTGVPIDHELEFELLLDPEARAVTDLGPVAVSPSVDPESRRGRRSLSYP